MTALFHDDPAHTLARDPIAVIRSRAAADARRLRALARAARIDGLPKADLRATNAEAAARRVLDHARCLSVLAPRPSKAIGSSEMAE